MLRAISLISSSVRLSGVHSKGSASSSLEELRILKAFGIVAHLNKAPSIKQVVWLPPPYLWTKCNTDGAARGVPGHAASAGMFRDYSGAFLGCFSKYLGLSFALHAELMAAMIAIEAAFERGWIRLWLECDSQLVVQAFSSPSIVPWHLRTRWKNCLEMISKMQFRVSHVFREGNTCADKLADFGVKNQGYFWWDLPPIFITEELLRNKLGLPNFRFINSF